MYINYINKGVCLYPLHVNIVCAHVILKCETCGTTWFGHDFFLGIVCKKRVSYHTQQQNSSSGKEVADTLPAIKIPVITAQGRERAASGRGTL